VSLRRAGLVALAAMAAMLAHAGPAAADPPRPSDFRSTVTGVAPEADGVTAQVVGGDAFLELSVDGPEVIVTGYSGEPYLRFKADGTVERNIRSTATYVNESRNADVTPPAIADNEADPEWEKVAGGGTYAWHDHRIHWMGNEPPPNVEPGDVVQDWTVDITVDDVPTTISGTLVLEHPVNPLPWFLLGAAALALVVVLGRRHPTAVARVAALVAAVGAVVVGGAQYRAAPTGSGVNPLILVVPLVALGAAAAAIALRRRSISGALTLAACAGVIGWAFLRLTVLWKPVLPTNLPYALDRGVTAVALGLALAAGGLVAWGGGLVPQPPIGAQPAMEPAVATGDGGESP
jgi:hypothetical protein